jgi:hypothetical protein
MYHVYLNCDGAPSECVASKLHPAVAEREYLHLLHRKDLTSQSGEVLLTEGDRVLTRHRFYPEESGPRA